MKLKPELTRCVLRLLRVQLCIWIGRIHEQTHDSGVGYRFAQHLQSDCPRGRPEEAHAGHIAIWSAEASDEPELDRIAADAKDNRDRRGRRLDHHRRTVVARVDHGHWLAEENGGQRHQAVILVFSVLVVDRDVAALDKAHAAKALAKRSLHLRGGRTRAAAQIPDHRHWLPLRARRERPRGSRAAEYSQQFPPSDGDCHTPLPCEVRRGTVPRHERAVFTLEGQDAGRFHLCRRDDRERILATAQRAQRNPEAPLGVNRRLSPIAAYECCTPSLKHAAAPSETSAVTFRPLVGQYSRCRPRRCHRQNPPSLARAERLSRPSCPWHRSENWPRS